MLGAIRHPHVGGWGIGGARRKPEFATSMVKEYPRVDLPFSRHRFAHAASVSVMRPAPCVDPCAYVSAGNMWGVDSVFDA